jgi:DNA-binding IclR family transcriptional regulator
MDRFDEISGRGSAVEVEELFLGVAAIAAPIEDRRRVIAGAIGISGSIQRICQDRSPRAELVGYVMESARSVSRELGGIPW